MAPSATGAPGTVNGQAASYDALDHLLSLDGESNGYTADGLLGWTQPPGASKTYFVYDGDTPVGEIDSNGTATAANLFGPSGLVERSDDAEGSRYYIFDPQGNTAVRLYGYHDNNYGTVLDTHAFDAYGQELTQDATNDPYAGFGAEYGYRTDRATGLDLLGHRFYDPVTARFVTRDPIGYEGGLNEYEYAGNNPVNRSDPSGFDEGPDEWEGVPYEFGGEAPMGDPELNASQGSGSMSEAEWNAVELEGPQAVGRAYDETVLGHSPEYLAAMDQFEKAPASTVDFGLGNGVSGTCMTAEIDEFSKSSGSLDLNAAANDLHGVLEAQDPVAASMRTSAVTAAVDENGNMYYLASSSENSLTPSQQVYATSRGWIPVSGPGHAEATGMDQADAMGLQPISYGASRAICPGCVNWGNHFGAAPVGPLDLR